VDEDGAPHTFQDKQAVGTLALEQDGARSSEAWSVAWNIFIPEGATTTLSSMPAPERNALFARWQAQSAYAQFGRWLTRRETRVG
jgi:inosine/xanthosine triphosphate pyrophosphatase family protein